MTKGFMKDKKFHPISDSKGIRKPQNSTLKNDGVKVTSGIRMKKDRKIKLENRASVGIRVYTEEFMYNGMPVVIEIHTHHPMGKYLIEPYWRNYPLSEEQLEITKDLQQEKFDKFSDAKSFVEKKFGLDLELDRKNSNDYQTWEENIRQTDRELPFERKFWALPEMLRQDKQVSESTEEFFKRKGDSLK